MSGTVIFDDVKDLTQADYDLIGKLIYEKSGINLGSEKMQLVRTRLGKILRDRKFRTYREYYNCVVNDTTGEELSVLLDAIATNTTHLFREAKHFEFLAETLQRWLNAKDRIAKDRTIRIWSAACSSGEEPHSIAMVAHDALNGRSHAQVKILATDISTKILRRAQGCVYTEDALEKVPAALKARYLRRIRADGESHFEIAPEIREMIRYARLNLMIPQFPFRNSMDIIFCRNVMIYFDRQTQARLVHKFERILAADGFLLVGHSESLHGVNHSLRQTVPAVYART